MQSNILKWSLALIITLSAAVYQRMTGPTYPIRGEFEPGNQKYNYKLPRSHEGPGGMPVNLVIRDTSYSAVVMYKKFKIQEDWKHIPMRRRGDTLMAELPHQPPAGKLEYFVKIKNNGDQWNIPEKNTAVTRFKGAVPAGFLRPHVLFMFLAMFMSNLSALEAIAKGKRILTYTLFTSAFLFLGGMILGPIVQKFAFGAFWTGVPFGWDLTDNKTLLAMIGWGIALFQVWRGQPVQKRWWVIAAAVILLLVYTIPHSTMGSELNYETGQVETG